MFNAGLLLLSLAAGLNYLAGAVSNNTKRPLVSVVAFLLSLSMFVAGFTMVKRDYTGQFREDNGNTSLKINEVYETLSVAEDKGTVFVVVRTLDGKHLAYKLDTTPPKLFKKTDNPSNPYEPFPKIQ